MLQDFQARTMMLRSSFGLDLGNKEWDYRRPQNSPLSVPVTFYTRPYLQAAGFAKLLSLCRQPGGSQFIQPQYRAFPVTSFRFGRRIACRKGEGNPEVKALVGSTNQLSCSHRRP